MLLQSIKYAPKVIANNGKTSQPAMWQNDICWCPVTEKFHLTTPLGQAWPVQPINTGGRWLHALHGDYSTCNYVGFYHMARC